MEMEMALEGNPEGKVCADSNEPPTQGMDGSEQAIEWRDSLNNGRQLLIALACHFGIAPQISCTITLPFIQEIRMKLSM
jgi:hypothetical protein